MMSWLYIDRVLAILNKMYDTIDGVHSYITAYFCYFSAVVYAILAYYGGAKVEAKSGTNS